MYACSWYAPSLPFLLFLFHIRSHCSSLLSMYSKTIFYFPYLYFKSKDIPIHTYIVSLAISRALFIYGRFLRFCSQFFSLIYIFIYNYSFPFCDSVLFYNLSSQQTCLTLILLETWHLAKNISGNFTSSFPPLLNPDETTVVTSISKAKLFTQTFAEK